MPHPARPPARPLPGPVLDQIAHQVAEAHAGTTHPTLVRVRPRPTGVEVGLCCLPDGVHPAEALLGHVVPPSWAASGVVAPARARSLADPDHPGTATTVVVLAGRDGRVTSHAVGADGADAGIVPAGETPVGRLPDLLLRTLGQPTPELRAPAAEWWRACWLDALVAAAAADPDHGPDPDHPLTSTLPAPLLQALVDEPDLCAIGGWARIRQLAALPEEPAEPGPAAVRATVVPHVEPAVAAWMDDGCFGRWLLDALPSVDELLDLAAGLVPPDVHALLGEVAGRTERPDHPSPDADPDPDPPEPSRPGAAAGEPAPHRARGGADPPR